MTNKSNRPVYELETRLEFYTKAREFHNNPDTNTAFGVYAAAGRWHDSLLNMEKIFEGIPHMFKIDYINAVSGCIKLIEEIEQFATKSLDIERGDYIPGIDSKKDKTITNLSIIARTSTSHITHLRTMIDSISRLDTEITIAEREFERSY